MKYLLDTCVISELITKNPTSKVLTWVAETEENKLFISVLTMGEIHKGIEKLPQSKQKDLLHHWVNFDLKERFKNRIMHFDLQTATVWGKIQAQAEMAGKTMPTIDAQIAATGICNDFIVVTRNTSDMEISGVTLYNPWE